MLNENKQISMGDWLLHPHTTWDHEYQLMVVIHKLANEIDNGDAVCVVR